MSKYGEILCRMRLERGMTQDTLAQLANVSRNAIANYETNRSVPNTDRFEAILDALGYELIIKRKR